MKASFTLRLPDELRQKVMDEAKQNQRSLNQYIFYTLAKEISYREAERALKERLKRAPSAEEALRLLDDIVPDVPPAPEDEMPHANIR